MEKLKYIKKCYEILFGETIYKNEHIHKSKNWYHVEFMSGTKHKMFSDGTRNDERFKHSLDVIWGLGYIKKIKYLGKY